MTEIGGIDFAWTKPNPVATRGCGYSFVVGYLSNDPSKNLSASQIGAYRLAGLEVGLVWETTATRVQGGAAAGASDGAASEAQANAAGYPADCVIFFAVDYDAQPGDYSTIAAYGSAFNAATRRPVGIYGGYNIVEHFVTPGKAPLQFGWQTAAWSGGKMSGKAHLYQRAVHTNWPLIPGVPSNSFDEDVKCQVLPLFGSQPSTNPTPPIPVVVPPAPVPHPAVLAWTLPAGNYYGNISGPATSHGGATVNERAFVTNIQQWLVLHGCVPGVTNWQKSTWCDGAWGAPTDAAMAAWHAKFYPGQPQPAQCWADDYRRLAKP